MTSSRTREATWRLCSAEGLAPDSTIGGDRAWDRILMERLTDTLCYVA